jgi:ribonuclease HII
VAGACIFLKSSKELRSVLPFFNDSKKLTESQRESLFTTIKDLSKKNIIVYGVGVVENTLIDTIGIKKANKLAMEKAL